MGSTTLKKHEGRTIAEIAREQGKDGVDATPTVVVAGKYRITGEMAGSNAAVFEVVDHLVAKELAAQKK